MLMKLLPDLDDETGWKRHLPVILLAGSWSLWLFLVIMLVVV
jgi:hypothetical protein